MRRGNNQKSYAKKILAMILICVITIPSVSFRVLADVTDEVYKTTKQASVSMNALEEYLRQEGIKDGKLIEKPAEDISVSGAKEDVLAEKLTRNVELSFPEKYDPRSENKVSALRSQVGGTCWLFATMAAAESNLIHKGLVSDNTIDLSELQTTYFLKYPHVDPLGYYTEDTGDTAKGDSLSEFMDGGDVGRAVSLFSVWAAPVYEKDASFLVDGEKADYATIDSWVLDESLTDKNYWHFKGSKTCGYDDIKDVKYLIQNYGGVTAAYYQHATYYIGLEEFSEGTYHYPYKVPGANHAVEIIGWDDNFPKENFYYPPEEDGAWLCKNSYGTSPIASNKVRTNGYFWLSYHENYITDIYAIEMDNADTYENIYSHGCDKTGFYGNESTRYGLCLYQARAYEDGSGETINGVMTYLTANTDYEVTVYANPVIKDGQLIGWSGKSDTVKGRTDYMGYYTIDMGDNPLYVSAGDTYAICLYTPQGDIGAKGNPVKEGICYSGTSLTTLEEHVAAGRKILCLRGLTNKSEDVTKVSSLVLSDTNAKLTENETCQLAASVFPVDATYKKVSYYSTDSDIATVGESGLICAKAIGDCQIVAMSYDGNAEAVCDVHVTCSRYSLNDTTVCTGESTAIVPLFAEGFNGGDAKLFSWSTDQEQIATISENGILTAHEPGEVVVSSYLKENPDVKASCKVKVLRKATGISFVADKEQLILSDGQQQELCVNVLPADTSDKMVSFEVIGESANVFSIDKNVIKANGVGRATVVAKTMDGTNLVAEIEVVSYPAVSEIIDVLPAGNTHSMELGNKLKLGFYVNSDNPEFRKTLLVTSSNPNVVKVSKEPYFIWSGGNTEIEIEAVGSGSADVTIVSQDRLKTSFTYRITVKEKEESVEEEPDYIVRGSVKYKFEKNAWTIVGAEKNKKSYDLCSFIVRKNKRYYVTKIGKNAFKGNTKLEKINIPSSVKKIENGAFYGCKKLKKVMMGTSKVTQIGDKAFYGCKTLTTVVLSKNLVSIGKSAFQNCSSLKTIELTSKIKNIGTKAFYKCKKLGKVVFKGTKVKTIGTKAFKNIKRSAKIKVPKKKYKSYKKLLKGKYSGRIYY